MATNGLEYHAEHSILGADYQTNFYLWAGKGYRLVLVTGFQDAARLLKYNTVWRKNVDGLIWLSYSGLTESQYQDNIDDKTASGYRPVFVDGFSIDGSLIINVIYHREKASVRWLALHGS